jgi:hypothetical protein
LSPLPDRGGPHFSSTEAARSVGAELAELGERCGRASRLENFEGHARSGDIRAARFGSAQLDWTDDRFR